MITAARWRLGPAPDVETHHAAADWLAFTTIAAAAERGSEGAALVLSGAPPAALAYYGAQSDAAAELAAWVAYYLAGAHTGRPVALEPGTAAAMMRAAKAASGRGERGEGSGDR
jgi:hypothetical protein